MRERRTDEILTLDFNHELERVISGLSEREARFFKPIPETTEEEALKTIEILESIGFVRCPLGLVSMGVEKGLKCTIEGKRANETPVRQLDLESFFVSKTTVTNTQFEEFDPNHARTLTSSKDASPVTCITYGHAISYAIWVNDKTGMNFSLPIEPQLVKAAAPDGWEYSYQEDGRPIREAENVYKSYPHLYPEGELGSTLEVNDPRVPINYLGLHHSSGNVSVYTLGHYRTEGHWGAASDGAYVVVFGGNFRTCPHGSRIVTRGIIDVAAVMDTVGIRLVHPDPMNYVKK